MFISPPSVSYCKEEVHFMRNKGKTFQELMAENRSDIQKDPVKMDLIEEKLEKRWLAFGQKN
ncbi:FbpB family small basic protein [Jeotgalibacillus sp. R-1-5s-1]|nr:FbpB family small basic protein [Jeotgalibacillus sp. R-1-5s-1]